MLPLLRSEVPGLHWPASPGRGASDLLALMYQLGQTEWLDPEVLRRRQFEQFAVLARHAADQSEFYAARLRDAGPPREAWDDARFARVPVLTRAELLAHADVINARKVPQTHGTVTTVQTSGSTGQPVVVRRTGANLRMWAALNLRDHLWHRRDVTKILAIIRASAGPRRGEDPRVRGWGPPVELLCKTGPCYTLPLDTDVTAQVRWLSEHDPDYLLTYPTNLSALVDALEMEGRRLGRLGEVRTIGETVTSELRERCRAVLGVHIVDSYSSHELGAIALQCPTSGLYHVHAESLLLEVLDDRGRPASAGETGRVVATVLHNFATPLIRYELGDHAEVGPTCPCGRGLPTLARILGRRRNMVCLPNGERRWPLVGFHRYREVADVRQYQLVQHSGEDIEMRVATGARAFLPEQEDALTRLVQASLRHPFRVRFTYFERELPRTRSGKFEEFVCLLEDPRRDRAPNAPD